MEKIETTVVCPLGRSYLIKKVSVYIPYPMFHDISFLSGDKNMFSDKTFAKYHNGIRYLFLYFNAADERWT